jgi:hypothetical protein
MSLCLREGNLTPTSNGLERKVNQNYQHVSLLIKSMDENVGGCEGMNPHSQMGPTLGVVAVMNLRIFRE